MITARTCSRTSATKKGADADNTGVSVAGANLVIDIMVVGVLSRTTTLIQGRLLSQRECSQVLLPLTLRLGLLGHRR